MTENSTNVPAVVTYREILSVVFLRFLPSVLIATYVFNRSRSESQFMASLSPNVFDYCFLAALFTILWLTSGNLLARLVEEKNAENK